MYIVCVGCQLTLPVAFVYPALAWVVTPIIALISAEYIVLRGVNPYLAWLMPPAMWALAGYTLSRGYSPSAGVMLVCALAALVGAAAGDVRVKMRKNGGARVKSRRNNGK